MRALSRDMMLVFKDRLRWRLSKEIAPVELKQAEQAFLEANPDGKVEAWSHPDYGSFFIGFVGEKVFLLGAHNNDGVFEPDLMHIISNGRRKRKQTLFYDAGGHSILLGTCLWFLVVWGIWTLANALGISLFPDNRALNILIGFSFVGGWMACGFLVTKGLFWLYWRFTETSQAYDQLMAQQDREI